MLFKNKHQNNKGTAIFKKYVKFRSSIYGRVVLIITILSVFLFVSFSVIFRSVNEQYLNTVIRQSGNNIGSIVEGALYHSMLENDKGSLQNTLDVINTLPGIDEVNMYDSEDNLVYSSVASDTNNSHSNPNCISCHVNIRSMFPGKEKAYKIVDVDSDCKMIRNDNSSRHLLIRTPILNEKSCYTSSCHAHKATDTLLGSLVIKIPLEDLDAALAKSSIEFFLLATFTTLVLFSVLIFFTRKRIKDPLNALIKVSIAVANGDKTTRVELKPNQLDDMRMVSRAFNDMLDNLQAATDELENWSQQLEYKVQKKSEELGAAQNELMHVERLASLGKLSSSVAHEINNPLSGILIYTKLLYKQLSNPELNDSKRESMLKHLKMIENETKRCGDIVKGLLDFSRKDHDDFEQKHLHEILQDTFDLMSHPIRIANITFLSDFTAKSDLISCSPNQIKQACVAMLVNATEAAKENGEITIKTKNPDEDTINFEISDNGLGIAAEDIPHIFEPFFSTKQDASGIGLGLAIVHGIIQNHKGKIQVKSELGHGTTISVTIPLIKN
ncbi:MAG: ATP-binding protein [Bacteroidetes bacterium]|nr:ATP-binding protein [Bacteroidota bacterium]